MPRKTLPKWVINLFFCVGLFSAICIRALTIINHYSPRWASYAWRTAVIGYIFFFGYRFYIANKRRKTVVDSGLVEEVEKCTGLRGERQAELLYILNSIRKSKEIYNYAFIFILSIVAIGIDFWLN
ncbi:hypothetical protein ACFLQY_00660 [Verrucomicrobiota bacterium]